MAVGTEKMQGGKQRHSHPACMYGVGQGGRLPAWVTRRMVVSSLQDGMPEEEQVGAGDTELMSSATPPPRPLGERVMGSRTQSFHRVVWAGDRELK